MTQYRNMHIAHHHQALDHAFAFGFAAFATWTMPQWSGMDWIDPNPSNFLPLIVII